MCTSYFGTSPLDWWVLRVNGKSLFQCDVLPTGKRDEWEPHNNVAFISIEEFEAALNAVKEGLDVLD